MDKPKGPGYFKFDRLLRDRLAATLDPVSRLLIQDMMILARGIRSRCKVRIPGEKDKRYLHPGEWITSSVTLSTMTGLSDKTIRRKLRILKDALSWFDATLVQGHKNRGGLWYHVDIEKAEQWATDRTESPVSKTDRTESPVTRNRPDRESSCVVLDRTESPVSGRQTGQRVRSPKARDAAGAANSPKKGRIPFRLRRNSRQLSAPRANAVPVWRSLSVLDNPTLSEQARRAVGEIMNRWPNSNGFTKVADLDDALAFRLETEPTRCVAQVFDVGQARAPKNILALLLSRLKGNWKKEPSDTKAWPFARSVMNSGRRKTAGPVSLGAILDQHNLGKRKAEKGDS